MTKREKIKEAYGKYWSENNVGADGWGLSISQGFLDSIPCDCKEMHIVFGKPEHWYRPIELRGIENNEGWVKVENHKELPEIDFYTKYFFHDGESTWVGVVSLEMRMGLEKVTHYKTIEIPKPPLY